MLIFKGFSKFKHLTIKMLRVFRPRNIKRNGLIHLRTSDRQSLSNWCRKISTVDVHRKMLIWEAEKKKKECLNVRSQNTIDIILTDGTVKQGISCVVTPLECAKGEFNIMFVYFLLYLDLRVFCSIFRYLT